MPSLKRKQPDSSDEVIDYNNDAKKTKLSEESTVSVMSPAEYRKHHEIKLEGSSAASIPLFQSFEDAPFPAKLQEALKKAGFTAPSPIQAQAWPIALAGKDMIAIAKTGSGKTCGYLLPSFVKLLSSVSATPLSNHKPRMLVMAPTRELAMQIHEEAVKFGRPLGIRSAAIYGGASKGPQIRDLSAGVHLVIGTPGRIIDLTSFIGYSGKPVLYLDEVTTLVLDEADRMLDMGFEESIRNIVKQIPRERQTLFFTATWPKAVQRIAYELLSKSSISLSMGKSSDELVANKSIKQIIEIISPSDKMDSLKKKIADSFQANPNTKIIVFCNQKVMVQEVANQLWYSGQQADAIHGDKSQDEREATLRLFKKGELNILVASDVAARGLDVKDVDMVINYDLPRNIEDYVHRIGRTGRAGATGVAISFFTEQDDKKHAKELVKIVTEAGSEAPAQLLALVPRSGFSRSYGGRGQGSYSGRSSRWGNSSGGSGGRSFGYGRR